VKDSISDTLIWTDQVCIDQINHQEKSHQVAFMRAIYEAAEWTYVVLSTPSYAIETAERGEVALKSLLNTWTYRPSSLNIPTSHPACKSLQAAFKKMHFRHALHFLAFCKDILEAMWWTRAWVSHCIIYPLCGLPSPA
jgi:Heterokaryon incompatibility protein (HET)